MSNEPWISGGSLEVGCLDDGCLGCVLLCTLLGAAILTLRKVLR